MKLRLKEDPKEWRNFAWVGCAAISLACGILGWREMLSRPVLITTLFVAAGLAMVAGVAPAVVRPVYRMVMTLSFRVGQVAQTLMLALIFVLLVVPLGLLLRAIGKDLLEVRRRNSQSYWKQARKPGTLEHQF